MHKRFFVFNIPLIYFACSFLLVASFTYGQSTWKRIENSSLSQFPSPLVKEHYYERITTENRGQTSKSELSFLDTIILPNEKGEDELFLIQPVQVLSSSISSKYRNIQTYRGHSKSRPGVKVRLSTHFSNINAWVQLPGEEDLFIQPVKSKTNKHFVYQKTKNDRVQEFLCKTLEENIERKLLKKSSKEAKLNNELRVFRIAIAGTAEYTSYWGDDDPSNGTNAEDAFAAVVSTINRINQVFEDEVGIRLELVSDASLLYEDPATDPFSGNFSSELQSTIDQEIGDEGYDVGHLFDFGEPNGDAGCIGCVCESGVKAQGYSTHPFEDIYGGEYRNDYFDLDYAAHEIGHQFGAFHTFSYNTEGTDVNAEPGSGTTIMGYAGITGPDDVQLHGDPYFHYYSIQNITNYVESIGCGETELLSTSSFSVDAGPDFFIPIGTPYTLSIISLEGEEITYAWEQLDSGQVTADNFGPYNPKGGMARSIPPKAEPSRTIPNLQSLLLNRLTLENPGVGDSWETVSLVERSLTWGLTVRKNTEDHVQLAQDKMEISVVATSSPFALNSQEMASLVWKGGSYQTILWDVAETNSPPFNVSEVEILLSTDGGLNFDIQLGDDVPNTGEAIVFVPNSIDTNQARLMIKAKGNIFFAINRTVFGVESRQFGLDFEEYEQINCDSESIQYNFNILRKEDFDSSIALQANNLPNGVQAVFSKTAYSLNDTSGSVILRGLDDLTTGDYQLQFTAAYGTQNESFSISLNQRESSLEQPLLQRPLNNAENQTVKPQLKWESNLNADTYQIQVATDSLFQNKVLDSVLSRNLFNISQLDSNKQYYWRVRQQNICGESSFSDPFTFKTTTISCVEVSSTGLPKNLTDATNSGQGVTTASINVSYNLPIQDIDVMIDIEHTYLEDLDLYLETPEGTQYLLTSQLGDAENDYSNTVFDQEASESISNGSPPFTGSFRPLQSIAELYNTIPSGTWKLIVKDNYEEDTGRLVNFSLKLCLEGIPQTNSDNDSFVDEDDNCPEISNEDQADIDNNGIGDVCDIFSAQNISITKKDASCPNKANGSFGLNALADFVYRAEIIGDNGYTKNLIFTTQGNIVSNLASGNYSICVSSSSFPDFEYCFETQIKEPEPLEVISSVNTLNSIMNLSLSGSDHYYITLNEVTFELDKQDEIQLPLARKLNYIEVKTANSCQGVFEQWINTSQKASVFPNPISENASLILPENTVVDILLLSSNGTLLWENKNIQSDGNSVHIPMSRLNPGFYLLQVLYPDSVQSIKLLKR